MYFLKTTDGMSSMYPTRAEAKSALDLMELAAGHPIPHDIMYRPLTEIELLTQFPFIRMVDWDATRDWGQPIFRKHGTFMEFIPEGWKKPWFRETMLSDLKKAAIEDGMNYDETMWLADAKEKYGSLRLDFHVQDTDDHAFSDMCLIYEELAGYFCCMCGKPHVSISRGWICPYCKDCWDDINGPFKEAELRNPSVRTWKDGVEDERQLDLHPYYDKIVDIWQENR